MAINGPSTELQRMAALAGLTYWDESSGLSLHPKYGSWFALRAVLVFEGVEHTGKALPPCDVAVRLHMIPANTPCPFLDQLSRPVGEATQLGMCKQLGTD